MKKILLCTFCSLLLLLNSFAQTNGYFSFTAGPAFATGKFAASGLNDANPGFAETGQSVNISYARVIQNHIGFTTTLLVQRNPLNTTAFENNFANSKFYNDFISFGSGSLPSPAQNHYETYSNWKFDKKSWMFTSLLVGGMENFPLQKPITFLLQQKLWQA